ncbi:MAG: helix-turn-helix domain-containing protein [Gammaproteobacteria bacterium]|nr:helix-turn-helix domain-containing protein [Gammaproteobacteria bacterium]
MSNKKTQEILPTAKPNDNKLLAAFPKEVQERLFPHLELCTLDMGKVLYETGDVMRHVYFPTNCIISLVYEMEDGASAEISVVGLEGILGIAAFMGGEISSSRALVLHAGDCYRLPVQRLQQEFNNDGAVRSILLRYTQSLIAQMGQTAVCNRHHTIDQQLCRWLLLSLDRLPGDKISMTQELIANMLGVRRESVTEAAGKLQHRGIIRYQRGRITVMDRPQLEASCCECYAVVKKESNRLTPHNHVPKKVAYEQSATTL